MAIVTSIIYDLSVRTEKRVMTVTVRGLEGWSLTAGKYK